MQRQERFHADYLQHLENLVQVLTPHVHNKFKELPEETRHTNLATAEFIKVPSSCDVRSKAASRFNERPKPPPRRSACR